MARQGLILRQHGATAYTEPLQAYFHEYRGMFDAFLMKIIDFLGARVWGVENTVKKQKISIVGWSEGHPIGNRGSSKHEATRDSVGPSLEPHMCLRITI